MPDTGFRDERTAKRRVCIIGAGVSGLVAAKVFAAAGREIVVVLTEIPCGVESGWHIHPGEEVGYILEGTVEMMIKDESTLTLHSGDGFLIPPDTPHNALDVGPDAGQMLSTYLVAPGAPLATFVDPPPT